MTQAVNLAALGSAGIVPTFRNRIINGAMNIDQRRGGSSFTGTNGAAQNFVADRFDFRIPGTGTGTLQQVADAPAGFTYSSKITVTGTYSLTSLDYAMCQYSFEGWDVADMAWGTASAKAVTVTFWAKASVAGTYTVSFFNATAVKTYPIDYTLAANTWTKVTVTCPGDTNAAGGVGNGTGLSIRWCYGAGSSRQATPNTWNTSSNTMGTSSTVNLFATNGATFQITGIQAEFGNNATDFEYRPYVTELALCQRYCEVIKMQDSGNETLVNIAFVYSNPNIFLNYPHKVPKRAQPTVTLVGAASSFQALNTGGSWIQANGISSTVNPNQSRIILNMSSWSGFTLGNSCEVRADTGGGKIFIEAEL